MKKSSRDSSDEANKKLAKEVGNSVGFNILIVIAILFFSSEIIKGLAYSTNQTPNTFSRLADEAEAACKRSSAPNCGN
jgi:peptidoglycan biosynthesis protein MviN/MurJ (putative lipid II flippase)